MSKKVEITPYDVFLEEESRFIISEITGLLANDSRFANLNDEQSNTLLDSERCIEKLHGKFILDSIYTYLLFRGAKGAERVCKTLLGHDYAGTLNKLDISAEEKIPQLCEKSHIDFLNSQYIVKKSRVVKVISKKNLVDKGAVYTQSGIARSIVEGTLSRVVSEKRTASNVKVLDFATGTGRFYTEIVEYISDKYGLDTEQVVLNCVYAFDLDPIALNITRLKAFSFLHNLSEGNLKKICERIILRNGLIRESLSLMESNAIKPEDFKGLFYGGFDAIVSNPPYLVLKPNKKIPPQAWEKLQEQIHYFRTSGVYTHSIEGMLNLYQLSLESMLAMLKPGGEMGIICPSTLFADLSATKLRKHLLRQNQVHSIRYYAEKDDLFVNVIQATCVFHLRKGGTTDTISINDGKRAFEVPFKLIAELFPEHMEIPNISEVEWGILRKLRSFDKLKNLKDIRSKRGELDLTIFNGFITREQTPYRLVRGNMISADGITSDNGEYVIPAFLDAKSAEYLTRDFGRRRLICQQISNAATARRLSFCYCEEKDILGNSCNYISAAPVLLSKLNILLNSPLLNWRFKITSSNNHINNYELDELPIVDLEKVDGGKEFSSRQELSDYVCGLYGLSEGEKKFISQYEDL